MSRILKAFYVPSGAVNVFRKAHWYLVIDRKPGFCYSMRELKEDEKSSWNKHKREYLYYSKRYPFLASYIHEPGSKDAFGGSAITVAMRNGEKKVFHGDLWSAGQHIVDQTSVSVGAATPKQLKNCYVFFASYINQGYFAKWLDENPDKISEYKQGAI